MQNGISEIEYEKFVLGQLAPMPAESQKLHVVVSTEEELLETEIVELQYKTVCSELEIWQAIKPRVKFIRQYKRLPDKYEISDFKSVTVVNRTLANGQKIAKTFDQHIADLQNEKTKLLEKTLIDELGDLLFFVTAAGSEKIDCLYKTVIQDAQDKLKYYVEVCKTTTYDALRLANYQKLAGGEKARYKNGYSVKEDLQRS